MRLRTAAVALGCFALLLAGARRADAGPVLLTDPSVFDGQPNVISIDFEDLSGGVTITNQYASEGVTFDGGLQSTSTGAPGFGSMSATNGNANSEISANFLSGAYAFGFDIFNFGSSVTTLAVYTVSGGTSTLVGTIPVATGGSIKFIGVDGNGSTFDSVKVQSFSTSGTNPPVAFAMDNLKVRVPEPPSVTLLCFGLLAAFGASRWRLVRGRASL